MSDDDAGETAKGQRGRKLSGDLRREQLDSGAFLFEIRLRLDENGDEQEYDLTRAAERLPPHQLDPAAPMPAQSSKELRAEELREYLGMERKGYRVTKDLGCLHPHSRFTAYGKGSIIRGHQRMTAYLWHKRSHMEHKAKATRNAEGRPVDLQVSHLCHRPWCVNPLHLVVEEQFMNSLRNGCGVINGRKGPCCAGVKCLRTYSDGLEEDVEYCSSEAEVRLAIDPLMNEAARGPFSVSLLPKSLYAERDLAALKRKQRNDAKRLKI